MYLNYNKTKQITKKERTRKKDIILINFFLIKSITSQPGQ